MMRASRLIKFVLVWVPILLLVVVPEMQAQGCTNDSFKGSYGYVGSGTIIAGPFSLPGAAVGRATFDGEGNFSGAHTVSINGLILRERFRGAYEVNPDCTGTAKYDTNTLDFVILSGGKEARMINTNEGNVLSFSFKKQQAEQCTRTTLEGSYRYIAGGTITGGPIQGPIAAVGTTVVDAEGNQSGADTFSLNGLIFRRVYEGASSVNQDCIGSGTVRDSLGQVANFDFVIVDGDAGQEVLVISTDPGTVLTFVGKKQ